MGEKVCHDAIANSQIADACVWEASCAKKSAVAYAAPSRNKGFSLKEQQCDRRRCSGVYPAVLPVRCTMGDSAKRNRGKAMQTVRTKTTQQKRRVNPCLKVQCSQKHSLPSHTIAVIQSTGKLHCETLQGSNDKVVVSGIAAVPSI